MEDKPLSEALGGLARSFTSDTGVPVRVQAIEGERLAPRTERELFRIAQEALTNVRKHAHAHEVTVGLKRRGGTLSLSIADDGRGFAVRGRRPLASHGLIGMRERARLLGGRLEVRSGAGKGTRVVARVPAATEDRG
jgi:two-component system NarL family sensor kinase